MGSFISLIFGRPASTATTNANTSTTPNGNAKESPSVGASSSGSATSQTEVAKFACFGAGCYWGTEKYFKHDFPLRSRLVSGKVGFMGPADAPRNPTYEDVCTGATGHVEVYNLEFDGRRETYEGLVRFFFQFHDPTTKNQQGNDRGTQYASAIFCYDDEQARIAERIKAELQSHIDCGDVKCFKYKVVSTDIHKSTIFYEAKAEHQEYLDKNPRGYCNHRIRLESWPPLRFPPAASE